LNCRIDLIIFPADSKGKKGKNMAKGKGKRRRLEANLKAKQRKGLTPKQRRKLPLALQKAILKKRGKG